MNEKKNEEVMTICSRIGSDYNLPVTTGIENICTEYGHSIWVSTTTSLATDGKNLVKHHCIDCANNGLVKFFIHIFQNIFNS